MQHTIAIAAPEDKQALQSELSTLDPMAEFRGLKIYSATAKDIPATMNEIGRLREMGYRQAGAGRDLDRDIDFLDTGDFCYQQLIVWDGESAELVAMYRYQYGWRALQEKQTELLRISRFFSYSDAFRDQVLPHGIELGRAVVNHQARRRLLGFFALWAGLATLVKNHSQLHYFFGNIALNNQLGSKGQATIVNFCEQLYPPPQPMLCARPGLKYKPEPEDFSRYEADEPHDRMRALQRHLQEYNCQIPSILHSYLNLGNNIWLGQSAIDHEFRNAMVLGIIVPIDKINMLTKQRFMQATG